MQYLMVDVHQRFVGTLTQLKPVAIGDSVTVENAKAYTVIGVKPSRTNDPNIKALTVIPNRKPLAIV